MCTMSPYYADRVRDLVRLHGMDDTSTKIEEVNETKLSEYKTHGDSISLSKLAADSKFNIVAIEDSDYNDDGKVTPGVKITTAEFFNIEGGNWNKFHTTRIAIVNRLKNPKLRADLQMLGARLGPLVCKQVKPKQGTKSYFDLVEV